MPHSPLPGARRAALAVLRQRRLEELRRQAAERAQAGLQGYGVLNTLHHSRALVRGRRCMATRCSCAATPPLVHQPLPSHLATSPARSPVQAAAEEAQGPAVLHLAVAGHPVGPPAACSRWAGRAAIGALPSARLPFARLQPAQPCEQLDELLSSLAHRHRGTLFARVTAPRGEPGAERSLAALGRAPGVSGARGRSQCGQGCPFVRLAEAAGRGRLADTACSWTAGHGCAHGACGVLGA